MLKQPLLRLTRLLSLLFSGLFAGFLVGVLVLESSLRDYDRFVYAQVRQVELDRLDTLASVTLIPALISTVILVASSARSRERAFWQTLAALAMLLTVFVITLIVNLPINSEQATWSVKSPPTDWTDVRDRWQAAHAVRTVAAVLAFGLLGVAVSGRPAPVKTSADEHGTRDQPTLIA